MGGVEGGGGADISSVAITRRHSRELVSKFMQSPGAVGVVRGGVTVLHLPLDRRYGIFGRRNYSTHHAPNRGSAAPDARSPHRSASLTLLFLGTYGAAWAARRRKSGLHKILHKYPGLDLSLSENGRLGTAGCHCGLFSWI